MVDRTRREAIWDMRLSRLVESMKLYRLTGRKYEQGTLHPYVSGLLLSSSIMAEIRQVTPESLRLAWGQILNNNDILSKEVDIMAYLGKPLHQWEDIGFSIVHKDNVDFGFVIEVKRSFPNYQKLKREFDDLSQFCESVLLIIYETENSMKGIRQRETELRGIGYKDVFHFVRWKEEDAYPLYEDWNRLMRLVSEWSL